MGSIGVIIILLLSVETACICSGISEKSTPFVAQASLHCKLSLTIAAL